MSMTSQSKRLLSLTRPTLMPSMPSAPCMSLSCFASRIPALVWGEGELVILCLGVWCVCCVVCTSALLLPVCPRRSLSVVVYACCLLQAPFPDCYSALLVLVAIPSHPNCLKNMRYVPFVGDVVQLRSWTVMDVFWYRSRVSFPPRRMQRRRI